MENCIKFFLWIYSLLISGIGGNPMMFVDTVVAQKSEFPFVVSLGDRPADKPDDHFCGGTLITSRHVLTAKQCLLHDDGRPAKNLAHVTVTIGSNDVTAGDKYNIIGQPITYEDYLRNIPNPPAGPAQRDLRHDLAVVTLDRGVDTNYIAPAILTDLTEPQLHREKADLAGWGPTEREWHPRHLQRLQVDLFTGDYGRDVGLLENNLLIGVDFPRGYHGSPLIIDRKLAGVITNGQKGQHASANYYRRFIQHFAARESPPFLVMPTRHE